MGGRSEGVCWKDEFTTLENPEELIKEINKVYRVKAELIDYRTIIISTRREIIHAMTFDEDITSYKPTEVTKALIRFIRNIGAEEIKKEAKPLREVFVDRPRIMRWARYPKYKDKEGREVDWHKPLEQLSFKGQNTGSHISDTYGEHGLGQVPDAQ